MLADTGETVTRELVVRHPRRGSREAARRGRRRKRSSSTTCRPAADRRPVPVRGLHRLPHPARVRAGELSAWLHASPVAPEPFPATEPAAPARRAASPTTDAFLGQRSYPGDDGRRQPVHTVYVPADRFTPELPPTGAPQALAAVDAHGGLDALCAMLGLDADTGRAVAAAGRGQAAREPIEDLRLDFEDGLRRPGRRRRGRRRCCRGVRRGRRRRRRGRAAVHRDPLQVLRGATRARGLRTLDLFSRSLVAAGRAAGRAGPHPAQGHHGRAGRGHGFAVCQASRKSTRCPPAGSASRSRWRPRS